MRIIQDSSLRLYAGLYLLIVSERLLNSISALIKVIERKIKHIRCEEMRQDHEVMPYLSINVVGGEHRAMKTEVP